MGNKITVEIDVDELFTSKDKLQALVDALRFYADTDNHGDSKGCGKFTVGQDLGNKAREALKQTGEM